MLLPEYLGTMLVKTAQSEQSMLRIYLYGYLNQVQSSRRLNGNVVAIWN
ncbi:Mobile element protein [Candidatus Rhodobacter oscarellae]|uniref:Mobile element protein n=1 Tax=Candidatus Rhodobacter oscarellae TaxID=1675527 RepID=A0A0J9H2J2_9RHOB|nr:Mobile element protein [Candidatus Rhodobacter lobularis]